MKQQELELGRRLGENIRAWRRRRGMRAKELARRASLTPAQVSKMETGVHLPSFSTLERVARALAVEMVDLISDRRPEALLRQALQLRVKEPLSSEQMDQLCETVETLLAGIAQRQKGQFEAPNGDIRPAGEAGQPDEETEGGAAAR